MMTISSEAGQRLAKARHEYSQAHYIDCEGGALSEGFDKFSKSRQEFIRAAEAVADELVEQRFHLMECGQ